MLTIGNHAQAGELPVRDVGCSARALGCDNAVGGFVAGTLATGDGGYSRARSDDLIGGQALLDVGGEFLGDGSVAAGVDKEKVVSFALCKDTTVIECQ